MLAPNARFVQRGENCYGRLRITGAQSSRKSGFRRKEAQKRRVYAREPAACFATTTKIINPKYYKHLKKAAQHSHLGR